MSVQDRFAPLLARCSQLAAAGENTERQVSSILADCDAFVAELPAIHERVRPCFPPSYDAFGLLAGEYRQHLLSTLDFVGLCSANLANEDILQVVAWVGRASGALRALGLPEDEASLGPGAGLEAGGVARLVERYVDRMAATLSTWLGNIVREDYAGRPKVSPEGRAWTPGPIDFFRILHEQLGLVWRVDDDGALALAVGRAALRAMDEYRAAQLAAVARGDLGLEMLAAAVNNGLRCREEGLRFAERVRAGLSRRLRAALDVERACEAFEAVTRRGVVAVTRLVFSDPGMVALLLQLGCSPAWRAGTCLASVLATVEDYLGDLDVLLQPQTRDRLMEAIVDETVALYCAALLCFLTAVGDEEVAAVRRDYQRLLDFFGRYLQPAKVV